MKDDQFFRVLEMARGKIVRIACKYQHSSNPFMEFEDIEQMAHEKLLVILRKYPGIQDDDAEAAMVTSVKNHIKDILFSSLDRNARVEETRLDYEKADEWGYLSYNNTRHQIAKIAVREYLDMLSGTEYLVALNLVDPQPFVVEEAVREQLRRKHAWRAGAIRIANRDRVVIDPPLIRRVLGLTEGQWNGCMRRIRLTLSPALSFAESR